MEQSSVYNIVASIAALLDGVPADQGIEALAKVSASVIKCCKPENQDTLKNAFLVIFAVGYNA